MKSLLENKLYDWLTTACQIIVLGFLFLFTSVPLITSGASLTALYHCISRGHTQTSAHICREYFSAFKSNFFQSLAPTILFLCYGATMAVDLSQVFTGKNGNLLPPFLWMVICLVLWVLANYIFAVISHLRASFPAVLLLSERLMQVTSKKRSSYYLQWPAPASSSSWFPDFSSFFPESSAASPAI